MRIWYAALIVLCCIPAVGCRMNPRVAALQRDNRLKEDEIYRLRWQVEDYQEELARCREALEPGAEAASRPTPGASILQRLGTPAAAIDSGPSGFSVEVGESISADQFLESRDVTEPVEGPMLSVPATEEDEAPAPSWPELDEPAPADEAPRWSPPPSREEDADPPGDAPRDEPPAEPPNALPATVPADPPAAPPAEVAAVPALPARDSRRVSRMRIDAGATGGHRLDGGLGDDGLRVVVELFDEDDQPLRIPAEVSIVLLDPSPALQSDAARVARGDFCEDDALVARWDFTTEEVAGAIRASEGARGIPLKVAWRDKAPQSEELHLFVRYTTADDRRLEDRVEVRIRLEGGAGSAGWQSAPQRRLQAPPEGDRGTTHPDPPAASTRLAGRPRAASDDAEPPSRPRLERPRWSPNRP